MTEPIFDATTERMWSRLPEIYRAEDQEQGWTFKKWLSGIGSALDTVNVLYGRFDFDTPDDGGAIGDSSELTDPMKADVAWLPWLGQFVGVHSENYASITNLRSAISSALTGLQPGTKLSIVEIVKTVLTGTQYVEVYDHSVTTPGDGGQWDVLIVTVTSETVSDPAAAVIAAGGKPAGILLHHVTFESTWDQIEAGFPTWADIDATTWQGISEVGL